ncbi:dipeptide ABC transporter ATP-binding protein [Microbacterium sp. A93]|uniref:dipeptide ABC transporter ATP-binding protein n=1 Tax=Microbacterium sp. A93 TaxID=3450716 RepID=UPI003F439659
MEAPKRPGSLSIRGLSVQIDTPRGTIWPLDGIDLDLEGGQTLGLVGESGSGKSMLVRTIMGISPDSARLAGSIDFDGVQLAEGRHVDVWGKRIAMVFQDSLTSLNPVVKIGRQVGEHARKHLGLSHKETRERVLDLLDLVGIPEPASRIEAFPHQLSGGMRQRVAIAMALACEPDILIADEATTALDVTIQQQILDLLQEIQRKRGMSLIIVSHDLGVVAGRTDRIAVMYAGRLVELASTKDLFEQPKHQYSKALLESLPRADQPRHSQLPTLVGTPPDPLGSPNACRFAGRCPAEIDLCTQERPQMTEGPGQGHKFSCFVPVEGFNAQEPPTNPVFEASEFGQDDLVSVEDLVCSFKVRGGTVHAVSGISFGIKEGETLGLVGESGCGKSTTAKAVTRLIDSRSGTVTIDGTDVTSLRPRQMGSIRQRVQIILQDPIASLNPRRTVWESVAAGLEVHRYPKNEISDRVDRALRDVGVDPAVHGNKQAFQLSGGQAQRVAIARAMVLEPKILVCDEPVSALDVSVQAQVINLLERLKIERQLTVLFVSHDLTVVRSISDRIAVMYLGKIVEIGDADLIYDSPRHHYTKALIDAVPVADPQVDVTAKPRLSGQLPSPLDPPSGCRFRTRCPMAQELCAQVEPPLQDHGDGRQVACHFPRDVEPVSHG